MTLPSEAEELERFLAACARDVEARLDAALPDDDELGAAMRHATLAGGKRIRPALAVASARCVGGAPGGALAAAAAVELIHTYSLIHDDLPCMDDDDLRRGKPTVHVQYGEALAVLAGDALQALAFEQLADAPGLSAEVRIACVKRLGAASGAGALVGGQAADLRAETHPVGREELESIHRRKTGALLGASAALGGLSGGGSPKAVDALEAFGREIGLVFQIVDDLLDEEATSADLGKRAGKDRSAGKATYPRLAGLEAARAEAGSRAEAARSRLVADLGSGADPDGLRLLQLLANRILERRA